LLGDLNADLYHFRDIGEPVCRSAASLELPARFGHLRAMGLRGFAVLFTGLALAWCTAAGLSGGAGAGGESRAEVYARVREMTELGRALFADPALSASGRLACATCHDPHFAYGPSNALPVQLGGADMRQPGVRAVPSLRYLQASPAFTEHFFESEDEGDPTIDNGPTGGLTWDGRVDHGRDQAHIPLLSPFEMANPDEGSVVAAIARSDLAPPLRKIFGATVFADSARAFAAILEALETFEQSAPEFYPYSSKYDAYLAGEAGLTPQEARGLNLFDDPAKGNCAHCHRSARGNDGTAPQFTDYGFNAIGVPRNRQIPANADSAYYDLGLCGPLRRDFRDRPEYCGQFRTPTLRNVALRQSFFHNGAMHSLAEVLDFYAERDIDPGRWYARAADGTVEKFDDLPAAYRANVNREPPFDRHPGDAPALSEAERADIVAFLRTLSDGYRAGY
jgi:cytochrome c peroxidase